MSKKEELKTLKKICLEENNESEMLKEIGLVKYAERFEDFTYEFICVDDSEARDFTYYPFSRYFIISFGELSGILKQTIFSQSSDKKKYELILPLDKREIKYATNNLAITHNLNNNTFGIFNVVTSKYLLPETNKYNSIELFNSEVNNREFLLTSSKTNELGLLIVRREKSKLKNEYIPTKYIKITKSVAKLLFQIYEVENKNEKHGLYLYYYDENQSYIVDEDITIYYEVTKQSVIPPIFDGLGKVYWTTTRYSESINDVCGKVYIEIFVNGKIGLLDVIEKRIVIPPVFDRIDYVNEIYNFCNHKEIFFESNLEFLNNLCAYIGDKKYVFFKNKLVEVKEELQEDEISLGLTQKLERTRKRN